MDSNEPLCSVQQCHGGDQHVRDVVAESNGRSVLEIHNQVQSNQRSNSIETCILVDKVHHDNNTSGIDNIYIDACASVSSVGAVNDFDSSVEFSSSCRDVLPSANDVNDCMDQIRLPEYVARCSNVEVDGCVIPELPRFSDVTTCGYGQVSADYNVYNATDKNVSGVVPLSYKCDTVLCMCDDILRICSNQIGGLSSQLNVACWEYYVGYEPDLKLRSYLLDGVTNGFAIVDHDSVITPYRCHNYGSVMSGQAFDYVNNLILNEIKLGKYVRAGTEPHCVHALGAVSKADGSYRPITDCKRPLGGSINNYMDETFHQFTYCTVDQVAAGMSKDCYMATGRHISCVQVGSYKARALEVSSSGLAYRWYFV